MRRTNNYLKQSALNNAKKELVVFCFQFRSFVFVDTAHLQETTVYQEDKHNK